MTKRSFIITLITLFLSQLSPSLYGYDKCTPVGEYISTVAHEHYSLTYFEMSRRVFFQTVGYIANLDLAPETKKNAVKVLFFSRSYGDVCRLLRTVYKMQRHPVTQEAFHRYMDAYLVSVINNIDPHTKYTSNAAANKKNTFMTAPALLPFIFQATAGFDTGPFLISDVPYGANTYDLGLQVGDLILNITTYLPNGDKLTLDATESSSLEFQKFIFSNKGSFTVTINRGGEEITIYGLTREVVTLPTVNSYLMDSSGMGYIKIHKFQPESARHVSTYNEFVTHLQLLQKAYGGDLRGLILDLRNNEGGELDSVIRVIDALIHHGIATISHKKQMFLPFPHNTETDGAFTTAPIIVLVNHATISAAELLAMSLQDHNRALVMGTPTFGKATGLRLFRAANANKNELDHLTVTSFMFYSPTGNTPQLQGVIPDITVDDPTVAAFIEKVREVFPDVPLYERELENPIEPEHFHILFQPTYTWRTLAMKQLSESPPAVRQLTPLEQSDVQLTRAVDTLNSLLDHPAPPRHVGKVHLYKKPLPRITFKTDLYEPNTTILARFRFFGKQQAYKRRYHFFGEYLPVGEASEAMLYETVGFVTGNEITLSFQDTPFEKLVSEPNMAFSFKLQIDFKKRFSDGTVEEYSHNTIVIHH